MKPQRAPSLSRLTSAIALLSLMVGANAALAKRPDIDPAEVEALKRQIVELRQRAVMCEVDSARSKQRVSTLYSDLEAARAEVDRLSSLQAAAPIVDLEEPVVPETESVEVVELEEPEPPPGLEPPDPELAGATPPPTTASSPQATDQGPPTADALSLYDEGYTLFHQEQYAEAERRFDEFIRKYPATDFTDNAQFWIGESLYAQGQYSEALRAFVATVDNYPNGNKVADALFKAGKCLEALGQTQQARQTFQEVLDRFPQSAAAAGARERLASGS